MNEEAQVNLQRLQAIEQSMQTFSIQKQGIQSQLLEIESAAKEIGSTESAYRIVGNIMVRTDAQKLKEELREKEGEYQVAAGHAHEAADTLEEVVTGFNQQIRRVE